MKDVRLKSIILALILILGCSSDKAAEKPPSAESLKVKGAIEMLSSLNKAYMSKDSGSFMHHISRDPSSNYEYLEEGIKRDFDIYEKITLVLTPRWARVKEDSIQLAAHWEGRWYDRVGREVRYGGNGVFSFKDEVESKLIGIEGDSPFGITGK